MEEAVHANTLTIVIPALNEEAAIGATIERCLAARDRIRREGGIADVEIIVVSDGSTDRTAEIAQGYDGVKVIVFEKNRGYGAAIKEGWRQGKGDLLGFIDADGTCDPTYFAEMCRAALTESADIVLGSRLGPGSRMPPVRKLGNRAYALFLGLLCGRRVTDTASGMRVVRRAALRWLYPLPNGLHFTPAMSARALLNDLRVVEVPMPYAERVGRSKLSVFRDGVRFLKAIFSGVLCYRPEKIFLALFAVCVLLIAILGAYPTEHYLRTRRVEEWMIYRFLASYVIGTFGLTLLLGSALAYRAAELGPRRPSAVSFWPFVVASLLSGRGLFAVLAALLGLGMFFLWPGVAEYVSTGGVTLHWSRVVAGGFAISSAFQTGIFGLLMKVISVWTSERRSETTPEEKR